MTNTPPPHPAIIAPPIELIRIFLMPNSALSLKSKEGLSPVQIINAMALLIAEISKNLHEKEQRIVVPTPKIDLGSISGKT